MPHLSPMAAGWLADAMLVLHAGVVLFVVLGQMAILAGAWRNWRWVRNLAWRATHLALMLFIAAQAWLGRLCPLTLWEQALRRHAGQDAYAESFVAHWLSRLIFFEAPWWTFVAAYSALAALVAASWIGLPPRRKAGTAPSKTP